MPTYSYRCTKCGHEYEKFQKISDSTNARCPRCRGKGERQITGGAGIHFKGSGFYVTDYARKGTGEKDSGGDKDSGGEKGKREGKTESKSEGSGGPKSSTGEKES